jgi:hypothetical protein
MLKQPNSTNILYTPMPAIHGVIANTNPVEIMFLMKTTDVNASPKIYTPLTSAMVQNTVVL